MPRDTTGPATIEKHTINQIPLDHRHGSAGQLFTLWFGANLHVLTIVTGALASTVFHQSFVSGMLAIVVGNLVGGIFMALHAAQGPQLGVPQMVQSRGQFGSIGAAFVVAMVVLMYAGYFASSLVIGGESLHAIAGGVSAQAGIIAIGLLSLVATIYGHDLIHLYARMMTYISGAAMVLSFIWIISVTGLPSGIWSMGSYSAPGFFGMVSIAALWQISYAPYVSDYSRYLPPDTGPRHAFWASYGGCVLGSVFAMALGALVGLAVPDGDVVGGLARLTGSVSTVVVGIFAVSVAASASINLYCGSLSSITLGQTFFPEWKSGSRARTTIATALFLLSMVVGLLGAKNFLVNYTHFIDLLLYVMVPWTAVNLVDFYLVRYGDYHVPSFFLADGGVYGKYNWPALICYGIGIVVQIPFIASDLYVGPIAAALGNVDISWVIGLVIVSPVYYFAIKTFPGVSAAPAAQPALDGG